MARRILLQALAAVIALVCTTFAGHAQYPDRSLKIIVAWPPGGVVDTTARLVGEHLATRLGQPVVVENRVGANGNIGTTAAARAPADGYTLQAVTAETHAINPHLYKALTYNVSRDFEPVALLSRSNFVLAAKSRSARQHRAGADRTRQGVSGEAVGRELRYRQHVARHAGVVRGRHQHELFARALSRRQPDCERAPHRRGRFRVCNAAHRGRVCRRPETSRSSAQHRCNACRLCRTCRRSRSRAINGFVGGNWYGIVAPHGIPDAVKARLADEIKKIAASPAFLAHARSLGVEADYRDGAALPNS